MRTPSCSRSSRGSKGHETTTGPLCTTPSCRRPPCCAVAARKVGRPRSRGSVAVSTTRRAIAPGQRRAAQRQRRRIQVEEGPHPRPSPPTHPEAGRATERKRDGGRARRPPSGDRHLLTGGRQGIRGRLPIDQGVRPSGDQETRGTRRHPGTTCTTAVRLERRSPSSSGTICSSKVATSAWRASSARTCYNTCERWSGTEYRPGSLPLTAE